jgi:nicotinamidase-related amidase
LLISDLVCDSGGYFASLGYDIAPIQTIIPNLRLLIDAFRSAKFQIYHTREGHRPDLSTLPPREKFRSRNGGAEIGAPGPLGRFLVRGEPGHDIISALYPVEGEPVIDKPMRSAFSHTDFDLLLRNRGIKNLIVGGVTTDVCVLGTVKDAIDRGYDVLLMEDGCAAAEYGLHNAVVRSVQMEGGIAGAVGKVEDVVGLLQGRESNQ